MIKPEHTPLGALAEFKKSDTYKLLAESIKEGMPLTENAIELAFTEGIVRGLDITMEMIPYGTRIPPLGTTKHRE